ncbi:unnamed protein product [Nyctereutes procyonoides]|uniref:(raccoon dog) hypothetical protein n=1 Tax=Nyctereutes procyonoides TaxID=34880 RepID=A0A811ZS00_NYCPR|nr:unnamed protein product [Nyctereutes procyonoides]
MASKHIIFLSFLLLKILSLYGWIIVCLLILHLEDILTVSSLGDYK